MRSARQDATTPRFLKKRSAAHFRPREEVVETFVRKLGNGLADQPWVADEPFKRCAHAGSKIQHRKDFAQLGVYVPQKLTRRSDFNSKHDFFSAS